ncbi:SgcJ/EcaC family oxidoreductase [Streptomyces sp. NBC_01264]|uniref:SgcJ/EcaC family oxidoreductase n=1 Tax=Streptomyces sp. NBC_01264 TaxID=2903804 RepID=UPI002256EDF3|nr:SgcJ/EcaC family oxidoreductase [Streptomyces sp. NBC_01264]MCX4775734.1 SgcJ/EcaC family oxidoreductase [Streptomyces sp. NBC_01264]
MNESREGAEADPVIRAIRTRRVVRALTTVPVDQEDLEAVVDSARYAPRAGNRRIHRYVVVTRPAMLRALRMVSPGMLQAPTAAVVVCIDWDRAGAFGFTRATPAPYVDVGTASATMLLAAHALGLGAGPVTSFSRTAAATLLGLPEPVRPELIVCLGNPATQRTPALRRRPGNEWTDVLQWDRGARPEGSGPQHGRDATRHRKRDEELIRSQISKIAPASAPGREEHGAEAFVDVYAQDADLTNVVGKTFQGRDAIVGHLRRLFADPRFLAGTPVGSPRSELRWVTDDVVIVKTYTEREGQQTVTGSALPLRRTYAFRVFHRADGEWLLVSDFYMDVRGESTLSYEEDASAPS